jgi:hypothetical protein
MANTLSPESRVERYGFEEYKMYYESTERVTDRRLAVNTSNFAITTASLIAVAVLTNWSLGKPSFLLITLATDALIGAMGALYCTLWVGQITDFKALNQAKFSVLNAVAPQILFSATPDSRVPADPFQKEWKLLQEQEATRKIHSTDLVALRSSNIEYLVPKALRVIYIVIALTAVGIGVFNRSSLWLALLSSQATT